MGRLRGLPHVHQYLVVARPCGLPVPEILLPEGNSIVPVSSSLFASLDTVRPGYVKVAERYLASGHRGLAVVANGNVLALGWYVVNLTDRRMRAEYFPLPPRSAWVHADWTAPSYRRRGLQKALFAKRILDVQSEGSALVLFGNVAADNTASLRALSRMGFQPAGTLTLARWVKWSWAWWRQ